MARNLFSIPIFFIIFRETLEAAIVVSVLFGLAKQIVHEDSTRSSTLVADVDSTEEKDKTTPSLQDETPVVDGPEQRRRLLRKLNIQVRTVPDPIILEPLTSPKQIILGAGLGLLISIAIGGALIGVWVTKASNLWEKAEALWEGALSIPVARRMIETNAACRNIRFDRFHSDFLHGHRHAQDGSRQNKMAHQTRAGLQRRSFVSLSTQFRYSTD